MSKLLKKLLIFGVVVALSIIAFFSALHFDISGGTYHTNLVSISSTNIDIVGNNFNGNSFDPGGYTGYTAKFSNGTLVITLKGTNFDTPISRVIPFEIHVPNTYGKINEVYLKDFRPNMDKLIWKDGEMIRDPKLNIDDLQKAEPLELEVVN